MAQEKKVEPNKFGTKKIPLYDFDIPDELKIKDSVIKQITGGDVIPVEEIMKVSK